MKKYLIIGSLALMIGGLTSCTKDGYQKVTRTLTTSTINIITSINDGTVYATPGFYAFNLTMTDTENTANLSATELIANSSSLNFNTDEAPYVSTGYDVYLKGLTGTAGSTGMQINNDQFLALYYYNVDEKNYGLVYNKYGYYFDTSDIGEYTFQLNPFNPWITIARYDIGSSYRVNTFQANTFFRGKTRTVYPQNPEGFETDDITYRFIINRDSEKNTYSADMILYNAKFAAEMPMSLVAVLVEGLDIEFTATGVKITGSDIVPSYYKNAGYDPLPMYIFKSVNFQTTDIYYTKGVLDYQVGESYQGHFEGSYVDTYYMK